MGGGDSSLVDFSLEKGYNNITVLDISAKAIKKAKYRLEINASESEWIFRDVNFFNPIENL